MSKDRNPYRIKKDDLPLIVLSDHSSGFVQWLIKWRTDANYNHIMMMIRPGEFSSQGNTYSSVPLDRYMTKHSRLKFWKINDLTKDEKTTIKQRVIDRENLPKWKRGYDYLGIFGQATGLKFINNPWKPYCSEVVQQFLEGIIKLPYKPSPADCNEAFKKNARMEVFTRWAAD